MSQLLIDVPSILIHHLIILIYHRLGTMLAACGRFHCDLCITTTTILIFAALLEENDTVVGVRDTTLGVTGKNPWCKHAVAPTVVDLEANVGQF